MALNNKPTTTVDPDYAPSKNLENHAQEPFGASKPIDHPCAMSTVDGNYSDSGNYGSMSTKGSGGGSAKMKSSDSAGVEAGGMDDGEEGNY